ncbi:PLAT domain-containing protein 3-like [Cynara cardunculus var. scolymus]|uniref:Lipase/lipooxygenase, PLAT/LH2 n=1 Tax=Cynara cardunculus var. scolymus TaxID=59895 RepID=A0A118JX59_CYNCS|nr:PLAT domain-containing protein 3-like [Cynara cardunculus var. scolymus]KVH95050.1 Lipase/lipooxygenase, PLAT/LH2 [Cynara cardunculus var. scolymus]
MGGSVVNHLFFTAIFILISTTTFCRSEDDPDCIYSVYIRTGSIWKGGSDSIMSLTLYDAAGYGIRISDIEAWGGLMGSGYDYFERGNLDLFSGRGPCLTGPPCEMNLTSDGTGSGHGWYCNYVEVTATGVHSQCAQQQFEVEQWLATDTSPYELTAIRNYCEYSATRRRAGAGNVILESGSSYVVRMAK